MPFLCANAGRARALMLVSSALLGCGTAATASPDASQAPDAFSAGFDGSGAPDAGSCMLPWARAAELSLEAPGLTPPTCADPVAIEDATVTVLAARITSVSETNGLALGLDFCSPADTTCSGQSGALTVRGAALDALSPAATFSVGQFVEIHWRVASPAGGGHCTRELEVRNPSAWDGVDNPLGNYHAQLLLAAAHGVASTLPGSILTVTQTPAGEVTDVAGCPSGTVSSLSFAVGGSQTTVEHGQVGGVNAFMSFFHFHDLASLVPAAPNAADPTLDWIAVEHLFSI